jgi:chromosome segregation ATPase
MAADSGTVGSEEVNGGALAGMLSGYATDQLVEEVIAAWDDLAKANDDLASARQRNRVLELDLAERDDIGAPERARLLRLGEEVREKEARVIHLERLYGEEQQRNEELQSSMGALKIDDLERENTDLKENNEDQTGVINEMEVKIDQLIEALEKAAEAGLTSVTAEEVRTLNREMESLQRRFEEERGEVGTVSEERDKLREIVEQVRGHLTIRDERIDELESQIQRIMEGPRSVSAEHDYLIEQIEELKRRIVDRNREYEALRRRERRLHREVFDRDERIAQMQLTMQDVEAGLADRTAELKALEEAHERLLAEMGSLEKVGRTREVVGKAFRDSLNLIKAHEQVKARKEAAGISTTLEPIEPTNAEAEQPGGTAPAVLRDIDDLE